MQFNLPDDGSGYLPGFGALALDPCAFVVPPDNPHVESWADKRSPYNAIPDTYAGALYRALPKIAAAMANEIAAVVDDLGPGGRVENIARLIDENLFNISFAEFNVGDPNAQLQALLERPLLIDDLDAKPETIAIELAFGRLDGGIPLPIRNLQGRFIPALPLLARIMAQSHPFEVNPFFTCFTSVSQLPYKLRYASHAGFSITSRMRDDVFDSVRNLLWEGAGRGPQWVSASIPPQIAQLYRSLGSDLHDATKKSATCRKY